MRMILGGVLDRHPGLQMIVGHWGELVLFYLDHVESMRTLGLKLDRPFIDYFRQNLWVTPSGLLSDRCFRWGLEVMGPERLLYSTDYPFTYGMGYPVMDTRSGAARAYLDRAPLGSEQKAAIGSGNWERLTGHLGAAA